MTMPNQKTRTVKMTRHEMNKIRAAITAVMISCEDKESREMWEQIKNKFAAQLDEQDKKDPDCHHLTTAD